MRNFEALWNTQPCQFYPITLITIRSPHFLFFHTKILKCFKNSVAYCGVKAEINQSRDAILTFSVHPALKQFRSHETHAALISYVSYLGPFSYSIPFSCVIPLLRKVALLPQLLSRDPPSKTSITKMRSCLTLKISDVLFNTGKLRIQSIFHTGLKIFIWAECRLAYINVFLPSTKTFLTLPWFQYWTVFRFS